jgi:hypothetical protein
MYKNFYRTKHRTISKARVISKYLCINSVRANLGFLIIRLSSALTYSVPHIVSRSAVQRLKQPHKSFDKNNGQTFRKKCLFFSKVFCITYIVVSKLTPYWRNLGKWPVL